MTSIAKQATDSPEFRNWFGKSRVVDQSGRPLRVYHGSPSSFDAFDLNESFDGGFHFGNATAANNRLEYWADGADESATPNIMPVYLSIQNPLYLDHDPYDEETWIEIIELAKADGFDGIAYPNKVEGGSSWVAFRPEQIKSAIGNNRRYEQTSPTITM
ncbi:ADP-ribosyltransferase-containing protein [Pseudomonas aeruginosa]